jgi:hypothetical protein
MKIVKYDLRGVQKIHMWIVDVKARDEMIWNWRD